MSLGQMLARSYALSVRLLSAAAGIGTIALVIRESLHVAHGQPISPTAATLIVLLGVAWIILRLLIPSRAQVDRHRTTESDLQQRNILNATLSRALSLSTELDQRVIGLFIDMLAEPATYRTRVVDAVTIDRRITRRRVSVRLTLTPRQFAELTAGDHSRLSGATATGPTSAGPPRMLVPVLQPRKGRLFDRFSLSAGAGQEPNVLPSEQSMNLYVLCLIELYRTAFGLGNYDTWEDDHKQGFLALLTIVMKSAAGLENFGSRIRSAAPRYRRMRPRSVAISVYSDEVKQLLAYAPAIDVNAHAKLTRLSKIGIDHYLIVAECAVAPALRLAYDYELSTKSLLRRARPGEYSALARFTHTLLDLPSGYVMVTMTRARHAQSFHLYLRVPDGSYIGTTHVYNDRKQIVDINSRPTLTGGFPYLRPVTHHLSDAHVYGRNLSRLGERLWLRSRVLERPDGTDLLATMTAGALLLLSMIFLHLSHDEGDHTDKVVAAIALPATAAAIIAFFSSAMRKAMTVSIAGFILSTFCAIAILSCFIIFVFQTNTNRLQLEKHYWPLVVASAVGVTTVAVTTLIIRTVRFRMHNRKIPHLD